MEPSVNVQTSGRPIRSMPYAEAREHAVALLTNRYAEEFLSEAEFEWWLARLAEADTAPRVEALVDLLAAPAAARLAPRTTVIAPEEGRVSAFMGGARRAGLWTIPHHLILRGVMCDMKIDLRHGRIPYPCLIDVSAVMGQVRITVPPEVGVEFNVASIMSTVENEAPGWVLHDEHAPRIVVQGRAIMSEVKVVVRDARHAGGRSFMP